jgi:phosphoglycerate dehydrogenase-like enzyme
MGFVGFGDIAKETAKLAAPFGMRLIALRRHPQKAAAEQQLLTPGAAPLLEATYGSEDAATFYAQCDFVVCSLPLTPETRMFIGRAAFGAMKSSTYFVSLGRGAVIDEEALYEALQGGKLAGAACDVFTTEPLPVESPLWTCENLLLTAHNADLTEDYFELAFAKWRQNLDACLEGQPWVTPVDVVLGY